MTKPLRPSAKAIIIRDGKLLALRMRDAEGLWYLLPGGGAEFGETLHEALRRECREEAGAEVEIGPLRFVREYISAHHKFAAEEPDAHQIEYMFVCRLADGATPGPGTAHDKGQLGLDWLPLDRLGDYRLYPLSLRALLTRMDDATAPVYLGDVN